MNKKFPAFVLSALFFFCFSCTDHAIPPVLPAIETETIGVLHTHAPDNDGLYFGVKWIDLGAPASISEYGNVYSKTLSGDALKLGDPGVEKIVFTHVPEPGNIYALLVGLVEYNLNYRAYAKLGDGTVIYGSEKKYIYVKQN